MLVSGKALSSEPYGTGFDDLSCWHDGSACKKALILTLVFSNGGGRVVSASGSEMSVSSSTPTSAIMFIYKAYTSNGMRN